MPFRPPSCWHSANGVRTKGSARADYLLREHAHASARWACCAGVRSGRKACPFTCDVDTPAGMEKLAELLCTSESGTAVVLSDFVRQEQEVARTGSSSEEAKINTRGHRDFVFATLPQHAPGSALTHQRTLVCCVLRRLTTAYSYSLPSCAAAGLPCERAAIGPLPSCGQTDADSWTTYAPYWNPTLASAPTHFLLAYASSEPRGTRKEREGLSTERSQVQLASPRRSQVRPHSHLVA